MDYVVCDTWGCCSNTHRRLRVVANYQTVTRSSSSTCADLSDHYRHVWSLRNQSYQSDPLMGSTTRSVQLGRRKREPTSSRGVSVVELLARFCRND
jgi:hypothetical protein